MTSRISALFLIVVLSLFAVVPSAAAPDVGPCMAGAAYDPACDVDHDGDVDIFDVQKTAGHWNQSGTWASDNNHNHLGQTWIGNNNPLKIEGSFGSPYFATLVLSNANVDGLRVTAGSTGLFVDSAGSDGLYVNSAGFNGVVVDTVHDHGLYVGDAGRDGVSVYTAGYDGFVVCRTGNAASCTPDYDNANGLEVGMAEDYGTRVVYAGRAAFRSDGSGTNAFYAYDAGDSGVWIRDATNWAGYFTGDINVTGNCTGCLIAQMAVNSGNETLQPGDIVAPDGIAASPFNGLDMLLRVRKATPGSALIGVVSGRAEPFTSSEDGTDTLVPRVDEPAAPGEYLSVIIYGPVQVKATSDVTIGQRVAVDAAGGARAMRRVTVEGVTLDEGGASLGMALDAAKDGLLWVLVNPQ